MRSVNTVGNTVVSASVSTTSFTAFWVRSAASMTFVPASASAASGSTPPRSSTWLADRRCLPFIGADLGCLRRLIHLDELQARARAVNTTLLDTERVGQGCVLASPAFERIARPTLTEDGRRAPALRFGDPRVQALAGALCTSVLAVTGITNKSLRALMLGLLGGANYTMNQASYDLARLRVNALITRIPGKNRYRLTGDGLRFAIFYTKLHDRLLRPLLAADQPPAPVPLRKALHTVDIHITETIDQARLLSNVA